MAIGYIVTDMPDRCRNCQFLFEASNKIEDPFYNCIINFPYTDRPAYITKKELNTKPSWCPIRPQPERWNRSNIMDEYDDGIVNGRNGLIDEMFGGENDGKTTS